MDHLPDGHDQVPHCGVLWMCEDERAESSKERVGVLLTGRGQPNRCAKPTQRLRAYVGRA